MFSRSPYALSLVPLLLGNPPGFYVFAMAVLSILLAVVVLCHAIIGLLRNWRNFRSGR